MRRSPLLAVTAAALWLITLPVAAEDLFVYFGSHHSGPNIGFSLAHFDSETGKLTKPEFRFEAAAPAFFVIHPDGRHLYTCNETAAGAISSCEIEPHTGRLTLLNQVPSGGADPCNLSLDRTGRYALIANYTGGSVAVFAIEPSGRLGGRTAFVSHTGRSVHAQRQTKPYAHSILVSPDNRFALAADLGADKVFVYRFNAANGSLQPNDPPFATLTPGSGPRHVKFHPNGRWVYVVNELASTVAVFNWNSAGGTLAELQTVSTLPGDFKTASTCAEVEVHPNGKFVYASNRGHDSLAVLAIDEKTGRLTRVENIPSGGKTPRNFAFDPTGKWILCTNHGSDNAVVFRVNGETGRLTQSGEPVDVPNPFCERFLPVR